MGMGMGSQSTLKHFSPQRPETLPSTYVLEYRNETGREEGKNDYLRYACLHGKPLTSGNNRWWQMLGYRDSFTTFIERGGSLSRVWVCPMIDRHMDELADLPHNLPEVKNEWLIREWCLYRIGDGGCRRWNIPLAVVGKETLEFHLAIGEHSVIQTVLHSTYINIAMELLSSIELSMDYQWIISGEW